MGDNFQRFLGSIDFAVRGYEHLYEIFKMKNIKDTLLFLMTATWIIIFYEWALALSPIGLVIFIFYNFYFKKQFKKPEIDYIKNVRFIQMMMGQGSDQIKIAYEFIEDFLFWREPDKAQMLVKELLKLPIPILLGLYYAPFRYFIVLGMWTLALSNS
jgi:hypothetical protein